MVGRVLQSLVELELFMAVMVTLAAAYAMVGG